MRHLEEIKRKQKIEKQKSPVQDRPLHLAAEVLTGLFKCKFRCLLHTSGKQISHIFRQRSPKGEGTASHGMCERKRIRMEGDPFYP